MLRIFHRFLRLCLLAGLAGPLAGCVASKYDKLEYTFAAHQYADPELIGGRLGRYVPNLDGERTAYVRSVPLVTSRNIVAAELIEGEDGTYAVRLQLDRHGQDLWLQACIQLGGRRMAVLVDGFHLFDMTIPHRQRSYDTILVEGPWEASQARGVATHATTNHRIFEPSTGG